VSRLRDQTESIPAFWLSREEFDAAAKSLDDDDIDRFFGLQRTPVTGDEDIHIAVVGETIILMAGHGIRFPRSRELSSKFLGVELLPREDAEQMRSSVHRFLATAEDEMLSDHDYEFLTLYQGEPDRIRRALKYLAMALTIPSEYYGVMILHR
jgi:hypothetical protein